MSIQIEVQQSADALSHETWQSLASTPYESLAWFRTMEAYYPRTRFVYLCAVEATTIKAILPLYDTPSTLYGSVVETFPIRFRPLLSRLRFLLCGSPLSFFSDIIGDRSLEPLLLEAAIAYARAMGFDALAFPFLRRPLLMRGSVQTPSLVDSELALPGTTFEDYLASFKASRRRVIRDDIRKASNCLGTTMAGNEETMAYLRQFSADKNGGKGTLTADFYRLLGEHFGDALTLILAGNGEQWTAATCLLRGHNGLYILHAGTSERDSNYFNVLFYEPIHLAYAQGVHTLNFRPGSEEAKRLRGCTLIPTSAVTIPVSLRAKTSLLPVRTAMSVRERLRRSR